MSRQQKGLTLIEVLVAMGIAAIAGALLVVIMVNSAGLSSQQSSNVTEGLNINDALLQLRSSIKQSNAVTTSYTDGSTTYTSGTNQLVLEVASIDSSGNIISNTFDFFVVFLNQNILHFKVFPNASSARKAADRIFSTSVDSLVFQYFNSANPPVEVTPTSATRVRISLSLKQKNGINFEKNAATTDASLRND